MLELALFPVFFAVVAVLIVVVMMHESKKQSALADALRAGGFVVEREPSVFQHRIEGTYGGRRATLRHIKHGKNGPWTTRLTLAHAGPRGFELRVDREGFFHSLAKTFGGQDVRVGDDAFDDAWRVRTGDEHRSTFILAHEVREALAPMRAKWMKVTEGEALLELQDKVYEPAVILEGYRTLGLVAVRVEATA